MARKKNITENQKATIIDSYLKGYSTSEVGKEYNVSAATVFNILKSANVPRRSVSEGNKIKWEKEGFRQNQIDKRIGKPSPAKGKKRSLVHIKRSPSIKGVNNPSWKGGTTKLSKHIRTIPEYAFWRMEIFKRDKWTCQICGAKNQKGMKYIFDADHIYPLHKLIRDNNITTIEEAISCQQLWDVSNGRCLCRDCHK